MTPHYTDDSVTLWQGDAVDVASTLPDGSVDCCVTSPPYYGLRDYGVAPHGWPAVTYTPMAGMPAIDVPGMVCALGLEPDPAAYVAHLVLLFREIRRVLADDAVMFLNLGDSYASQTKGSGGGGGKSTLGISVDGTVRMNEHGRALGVQRQQFDPRKVDPGVPSKNLLGIPWRVAFALQADGWVLRNDVIWAKCLSGGTVVYARINGVEKPVTVKDMARCAVGAVELWTGERWSRVLRCDPTPPTGGRAESSYAVRQARYRGKPVPAYAADLEVELRNGERIGCTPNHKWPTTRGLVRADELLIGDVVDSCRLAPGTKTPAAISDDVGWFVGLYLAEGSRSGGTIQIASHIKESERFGRLRVIAADHHGTCVVHHTKGNSATANLTGPVLHGLIDTYIGGRVAKDKHLKAAAWQRSDAFIGAILDGYLSGDGHYDGKADRWMLGFTQNDALASDLRTMCARLGYSLRLRRAVHTCQGAKYPGWRGSLLLDRDRRKRPDSEVVAIRQSRARQFWNIEIADEPHLFALASGVLTCNSNGMPESVTDRLATKHEHVFLFSKRAKYWFDLDPIREPRKYPDAADGSRVFGGANKAPGLTTGSSARRTGNRYGAARPWANSEQGDDHDAACPSGRNPGDVWSVNTQPFPGAHFACMPLALAERCIQAGCKPGGTVLDPFSGSGTTGLAAARHGRRYVGIDLNAEYLDLSLQTRLLNNTLDFTGSGTP